MKEPREKVIVGHDTWHGHVIRWEAPIGYEIWKAIACAGRHVDETRLQQFYAAQWEPSDCAVYLYQHGMARKRPKEKTAPKARVVTLDVDAINKRFAVCLWRECSKLLTRRMTPEARKLVCDMQARMEAQAGIERLGDS